MTFFTMEEAASAAGIIAAQSDAETGAVLRALGWSACRNCGGWMWIPPEVPPEVPPEQAVRPDRAPVKIPIDGAAPITREYDLSMFDQRAVVDVRSQVDVIKATARRLEGEFRAGDGEVNLRKVLALADDLKTQLAVFTAGIGGLQDRVRFAE